MWNKKHCVNCMRDWIELAGESKPICFIAMVFTDDVEHTMVGTAIHFNLRESRAKKKEEDAMDNLWLELPWWF